MLPEQKVKDFYNFITEREKIRLRKEAGSPFPWTEDPILQAYKFTNVFRKYDRTTKFFIDNFYSKEGQTDTRERMLLNCATFRYFGTMEFAKAVGWQTIFNPDKLIGTAQERFANGQKVFTGAYIITNLRIKAPKEEVVVNVFLKGLSEMLDPIIYTAEETNSWQETHNVLQEVVGFGGTGFMAKETLLDTMHCNFWQTKNKLPKDYWEWTPIGPGARRGINRLCGNETDARISVEDGLKVILELASYQNKYWPKDWERLAPTDCQFQLCEYDKRCRVLNNEGRPRSKYVPKQ